MNSLEALKRLKQETCPATYMPDFDKDLCIDVIGKDLDKLEHLDKYVDQLKTEIVETNQKRYELEKENQKLKKVIEILKEKLDIKLEIYHNGGCILNHKIISNCVIPNERCLRYLEVEEYELLKEVLGK